MSPLKHSTNIAARMGRWSASHRKTAIFGWLAFVVASFAIGIAVADADDRRDRLQRRRGPQGRPHHPRRRASRSTSSPSSCSSSRRRRPSSDPAFRAVVDRRRRDARRLRRRSTKLRSPLAAGNEGQISKDGHAALIQFSPKGSYDEAVAYIDTITAATDKVQDGEPRLLRRRGRLGLDRQGARRDVRLAARDGGPALDPAHARDPAARVRLGRRRVDPAPARADVRVRDDGPRRAPEPDRPDGRERSRPSSS